jgi:hypothetical protein
MKRGVGEVSFCQKAELAEMGATVNDKSGSVASRLQAVHAILNGLKPVELHLPYDSVGRSRQEPLEYGFHWLWHIPRVHFMCT